MDLSKFSTADLKAYVNGDLSKMSTQGLKYLSGQADTGLGSPSTAQKIQQSFESTSIPSLGDAAQGVAQGISDVGQQIANLGVDAYDKMTGKKYKAAQGDVFAFNPKDKNTNEAKLGHFLGQLYAGGKIANSVPALLGLNKSGVLPMLGRGVASGATFGALTSNDDKNLAGNTVAGGILGGALEPVSELLPFGMKALAKRAKKGSAVKTGGAIRTPEEAKALYNLLPEEAKKNVDLGSLINSPALTKAYGSVMGNIPFSGIKGTQETLIGHANNAANNILEGLKGKASQEDVPDILTQKIAKNSKDATEKNKKMFQDVFDDALKSGVKEVDLPQTKKVAKQLLKEDNQAIIKTGKLPPELKSSLKELLSPTPQAEPALKILNEKGEPFLQKEISSMPGVISPDTAKDEVDNKAQQMHFLSSDLGDAIRSAEGQNNFKLSRQLKQIKGAVDKDLDTAFEGSNNPDLSAKWKKARADFKENVMPYRDNYIKGILSGKKNNETIGRNLVKSQHEKVLKDLPKSSKQLIGFELLKKAAQERPEGGLEVNPTGLWNKYLNISNPIKKRLFPKEIQDQMKQLGALNKVTAPSKFILNPPKTGYGAYMDAFSKVLPYAAAGASYAKPELMLPLLSGLAGIGRMGSKALRSEALKEAYFNPEESELIKKLGHAGKVKYPILQILLGNNANNQ